MFAQLSDYLLAFIHYFSDRLLTWIHQYGPITLFILLALGIIILPIPDEPLMMTAGILISKGELNPFTTVLAAILGSWCGITVSYMIGAYLAPYMVNSRLGSLIGLQSPSFSKTKDWFNKIGKWSLLIGYFIPGVRHFTGYTAGFLELPYRQFSIFAYLGGVLWVSIFLTIGYIGHQSGMVDKLWDLFSMIIK